MARYPRFILPGQPQHVIQRGNNRQNIFKVGGDYQFYLKKLIIAAKQHQCDIHAYVLMTNHVHLLVTPHAENSIGKMMQTVGRYYVQYFNHSYKRTGTLWEGRYKATLIDTEQYLLTCMRYIELNPVRAKDMVSHPSDYPWSSYSCNACGEPDALVTPHNEYKRLGKTATQRQAYYRQRFRKAWALGTDRFISRMEKKLKRPVESRGQGGDRKSKAYLKHTNNQRV